MWRKRHKPEEIVAKLLQVNVLVTQGQGVADERNPVASRSRARRAGCGSCTDGRMAEGAAHRAAQRQPLSSRQIR
jgi:hypothetical protein